MSPLIPLLTIESQIKRKLRYHLKKIGFKRSSNGMLEPLGKSKNIYREMHSIQRLKLLKSESSFIKTNAPKLINYFASGSEIDPINISPRLELIYSPSWQSDLFRMASLTWSVPVSKGYGRRMRFLVWDENNGKLIGIIALGDPVFNLKVRDDLIGWSTSDRKERLVNVMDAYVLGSLPPYNIILGGKLLACLIRTREVYNYFSERYSNNKGLISGKKKNPSLLMVTTSSALGKSSVYNRLKLDNILYFKPIGYTSGWGHFHIPIDLFENMRKYLKRKRHPYADGHQFGNGPSWKIRVVRQTLEFIRVNPDILRHGIFREVFLCKLASNAESILRENTKRPYCKNLLSVDEVSNLAKERWIIPRSNRFSDFKLWNKSLILETILGNKYSTPIF
ncbi:MAG: DUF4338 domain-containing protein [Candidatus Scalindua sediminis]|nr:DUF4338 domain-containing protein [Candidatus Scalindua sediminis]